MISQNEVAPINDSMVGLICSVSSSADVALPPKGSVSAYLCNENEIEGTFALRVPHVSMSTYLHYLALSLTTIHQSSTNAT